MSRVVQLVGVDLFFRGKIDAMLLSAGYEVVAKPGGPAPDVVIADVGKVDPADVLARFPGVPALGFANVVPRSVFSERLPELVAELLQ